MRPPEPQHGELLAGAFAAEARRAGLGTRVGRGWFGPYVPGWGRTSHCCSTDGFTPTPSFRRRAGAAAEGAYVAINGIIVEALGPSAAGFVRRFGTTQPGLAVEPSAVYAAQSAEVMIDAIARSDGTRRSVAQALLDTRLRASLLGDVSFDANGDARSTPVTVLRLRARAEDVVDFPGAVLERVVR